MVKQPYLILVVSIFISSTSITCEQPPVVIEQGVSTDTKPVEATQAPIISESTDKPGKDIPIFILYSASALLMSGLYGAGMYYYPKHVGFLTLLGYSVGPLVELKKYRKGLSDDATWLEKAHALQNLLILSITSGLAVGYGLGAYSKGARA